MHSVSSNDNCGVALITTCSANNKNFPVTNVGHECVIAGARVKLVANERKLPDKFWRTLLKKALHQLKKFIFKL